MAAAKVEVRGIDGELPRLPYCLLVVLTGLSLLEQKRGRITGLQNLKPSQFSPLSPFPEKKTDKSANAGLPASMDPSSPFNGSSFFLLFASDCCQPGGRYPCTYLPCSLVACHRDCPTTWPGNGCWQTFPLSLGTCVLSARRRALVDAKLKRACNSGPGSSLCCPQTRLRVRLCHGLFEPFLVEHAPSLPCLYPRSLHSQAFALGQVAWSTSKCGAPEGTGRASS